MKKKGLEKISFAKIKDVLSRYEMRSIMAGYDGGGSGGGTGCGMCTSSYYVTVACASVNGICQCPTSNHACIV